MTTAFESLYGRFHKNARLSNALAERASAPLLISPSAAWAKAPFKVLIVGQETLGWRYTTQGDHPDLGTINSFSDFSASPRGVEAMMRAYQTFLYESEYWKRNSAFWRAFRLCSEAVESEQSSVLWTNIFKVDVEGSVVQNCSVAERALILEAQRDLLKNEIALLMPDVVLFFSGPTYDPALEFAFPDISFHPFHQDAGTRELAYVRSSELAPVCVRSFHPSYLQRSRRWPTVLRMVDWLQKQMAQS